MCMSGELAGAVLVCLCTHYWVLVKGLNLSSQKKETILFIIDPLYGNLISIYP